MPGETLRPEERIARVLGMGGGPVAVAESCTGGLVAHRITRVPGSSAYFDRAFVVYSNRAKEEMLGVPPEVLLRHGAVSEACARAMLEGVFARSPARIGAAVTGIAGPTGGSPGKPVGTVWIAWGRPGAIRSERLRFQGTRTEIQEQTAEAVLERLAREAGG